MKELTIDSAAKILARNTYGRLACYSPSRDTSYIVPMSYTYRDGVIYLAMLPGQKLDFLHEHVTGVCFEVDEIDDAENWLTAIATGAFRDLGPEERAGVERDTILRLLHGPLRSLVYGDEAALAKFQLGAIHVTSLTARQDRWSWEADFPQTLKQTPV